MLTIAFGKFVLALLLLLGGIKIVSQGLHKIAGGFLYNFLQNYTSTPRRGFILGTFSTLILQSSSLVTVMVVGFINGKFLTLLQGLSIVIGANLGTTVTSQLFSLQTRYFIKPLLLAGILLYFTEIMLKRPLGSKVLWGLAAVLGGIELLTLSLEPFSATDFYRDLYQFSRGAPWRGVLTGAMTAAIIQSSSVTIGMVVVLAKEKMLSLPEALAMILGADLGTCITSLIAAVGTALPARQVAWGHLFFNVVSILIVVPFWHHFLWLISATARDLPRQVANAHMLYNLIAAIVLLPVVDKFAHLLEYVFKK